MVDKPYNIFSNKMIHFICHRSSLNYRELSDFKILNGFRLLQGRLHSDTFNLSFNYSSDSVHGGPSFTKPRCIILYPLWWLDGCHSRTPFYLECRSTFLRCPCCSFYSIGPSNLYTSSFSVNFPFFNSLRFYKTRNHLFGSYFKGIEHKITL